MLDRFSDAGSVTLLILFPLTYLIHISEEYWAGGGYSDYLFKTYSVELSKQRFLGLQVFGLFLMVLGVVLGIILRFPLTMIGMLSAVVIGNGLVHVVRSISGRTYVPGLITAISLWLPLGFISVTMIWPFTSAAKFVLALLVGFASNWIVELISFRDTQMRDEEAKTN